MFFLQALNNEIYNNYPEISFEWIEFMSHYMHKSDMEWLMMISGFMAFPKDTPNKKMIHKTLRMNQGF